MFLWLKLKIFTSAFLFWPVENASLVSIVSTLLLLCDDSDILTFSVNSQKAEKETRKSIQ